MASGGRSGGSEAPGALTGAPLGSLVELIRLSAEPAASHAAQEVSRRFLPLLRKFWHANNCGEYDDFSQEVLTRLFAALPHLRVVEAFPGLFRQIVVTSAADFWRRQRPPGPEVSQEELESLPDPSADFSEELVTKLLVRSYLELLPSREREVVELLYFADLDPAEVAQMLGIAPGAVRTTKVRAIGRLRDAIRKM